MKWIIRLWQRFRRFLFGKSGVFYVGGAENLPAPLESDREAEIIDELMVEEKRENARKILIEHNLRLVVYIAKKFENTGVSPEDLVSIGTIGLIKAINTFKKDKNIKLATYASRCIENEILMYLRKNSNQKINVSLDEPLNVDWDGNELLLSDILGTENDITQKNIEHSVDLELLKIALSKLSDRERKIVEMRFGIGREDEELTQKQVADMMGISQSYISRLEKRIMKRLRNEVEKLYNR
ncbi:MAG: RNA polymerase sporulation sigma factor SigE [Clostridia bacterium]|nr:RNA polymerase sporulation sigma factor SigE [Clostridia bacterium]